MIEDDPEISIVGEASDGKQGVQLAQQLKPQVIVMDMAMPEMDGVQATREILRHLPKTAILILSMYSQENYVRNAFDAGALRLHPEERHGHRPASGHQGRGRGQARARSGPAFGRTRARRHVRQAHAAREADPAAHRGGKLEQGDRGHAQPQRQHGGGAPRQPDGRAGRAPHGRAGGVRHPEGARHCREPQAVLCQACRALVAAGAAGDRQERPGLPLRGRHLAGGSPLRAQQRRLRRQVPARVHGLRLRVPRLRRRRLAGHPAGAGHGLARPQASSAPR